MAKTEKIKVGTAAFLGRPNAGKSTLLNALLKQKVSITSPKPQTTQFSIEAIYEDERGQILFIDTPGIFAKADNAKASDSNFSAEQSLKDGINVVVYVVDRTRERGTEENKVLGIVRKVQVPKILVINKIDKREPNYIEQYMFLEEEFDVIVHVSAKTGENLNKIVDNIFEFLPYGEKIIETKGMATPAMNLDSKLYLQELIREKAFLRLREELPYVIDIRVDEVIERTKKDLTVIKARIIAPERYKRMIIGAGGKKIKEIGSMARRELELATNRKIYIELTVEAE